MKKIIFTYKNKKFEIYKNQKRIINVRLGKDKNKKFLKQKISYYFDKYNDIDFIMNMYNVYNNNYLNCFLIYELLPEKFNKNNIKYLEELKETILTFKYRCKTDLPQFKNFRRFETSPNFWMCYGWSEKEAIKKANEIQKSHGISISKTLRKKEKYDPLYHKKRSKRCKEYWINLGYSEDDAIKTVSKHQLNFNLDICVCKHGVVNGYEIWLDRQRSWQNTLNSKSQEEIDDINLRKSNSKKAYIKKYGNVDGLIKYNIFCDHQSNARTLENYIKIHGEKVGTKKFNHNYRYNGSSLEKCILKYGEKEGREKFKEFNINKSLGIRKTKKIIIENIINAYKLLSNIQKESFSFEHWINKSIYNINRVLKNLFDNDIENLYNEIPYYIKKSFKNNQKIFRHSGRNYFSNVH